MSDAVLESVFAGLRRRLPAVSAAEAPLLFEANEPLRLHAGRWWRPLESGEGGAYTTHCVTLRGGGPFGHPRWQTILDHADGGHRVRPYGPLSRVAGRPALKIPSPEHDPDGFEAALPALAEATLRSAMLIGGVLHCACEGPAVIVQPDERRGCHLWLASASDAELGGGVALFDPARIGEAMTLAGAFATGPVEPPRYGRVLEGAPGRNDAADVPMEVVHDTLAACLDEGVGLIAPDALDAIADLKAVAETGPCPAGRVRRIVEALHAATALADDPWHLPDGPLRAAAEAARVRVHAAARFSRDRIASEAHLRDEDAEALSALAAP